MMHRLYVLLLMVLVTTSCAKTEHLIESLNTPIDVISPEIVRSFPGNQQPDFPKNARLIFYLDEQVMLNMDSPLYLDGEKVEGQLLFDQQLGDWFVFIPNVNLIQEKTYQIDIQTTDISDLVENPIQPYSIDFQPVKADYTPPVLNRVSPEDGADMVPTNTNIEMEFSETIDLSHAVHYFTLNDSPMDVQHIKVSDTGNVLIYQPENYFPPNSTIQVHITSAVSDLAGNKLDNPFSFSFKTGPEPDFGAPEIFDIEVQTSDTAAKLTWKTSNPLPQT